MNAATKDTTPWTIWFDAVVCAAKVGVHDIAPEVRARMQRAYQAGEAVWMAADELTLRVRQGTLAHREGAEMRVLRSAIVRSKSKV